MQIILLQWPTARPAICIHLINPAVTGDLFSSAPVLQLNSALAKSRC